MIDSHRTPSGLLPTELKHPDLHSAQAWWTHDDGRYERTADHGHCQRCPETGQTVTQKTVTQNFCRIVLYGIKAPRIARRGPSPPGAPLRRSGPFILRRMFYCFQLFIAIGAPYTRRQKPRRVVWAGHKVPLLTGINGTLMA